MKRVYLAAPFRKIAENEKGRMYGKIKDNSFIKFLERIEKILIDEGFSVCLPHRDEGDWGYTYIQPSEIAKICFSRISESDIILAFPKGSRGFHIELGYAIALKKKIIVMLEDGEKESTFVSGFPNVCETIIERYSNEDGLIHKLRMALSKITRDQLEEKNA